MTGWTGVTLDRLKFLILPKKDRRQSLKMLGRTGAFSYSPGGFTQGDYNQTKQTFPQDDHRGSPLQKNNMSRPNGRSIYMQRKEYSETLNRDSESIHVRVEHLFTCELDGHELKTMDDCLAKLKRLDVKGRLWPQEMIMEIQGGFLVFSDIETKAELESHALASVLQIKAVLDSCAYNSVLVITLRERSKLFPQVLMFQCEETGAEHIKSDLDKFVKTGDDDVDSYRDRSEIRVNLENIIGQNALGNIRSRPAQRSPSPLFIPTDYTDPPPFYVAESTHYVENEIQVEEEIPPLPQRKEKVHKKDIFNLILDDLEIFMDKVAAASTAPQKEGKPKKGKAGKSKKKGPTLPPIHEYVSCLQKIKYGFNLLGHLEGTLINPSAEDFVHIFFNIMTMIMREYPPEVPATVISPLLTVSALRLLGQTVDQNEDQLWRSLGDSWNLSRSGWPDDAPPYIPTFYNGWQPPPPTPSTVTDEYDSMSSNSPRYPLGRGFSQEPVTNGSWGSLSPSPYHRDQPKYTQAINDFVARDNQQLSVMKGEMVQVVQKSGNWWLVRNNRNGEGHVPSNVLEPMSPSGSMEDLPRNRRSPVALDMNSSAAEVRAWLEYKGFSRLTVDSLGVLNGRQLLGMTKDELRAMSPEDGAKVAYQLQAVKSAIALHSEPSSPYSVRF